MREIFQATWDSILTSKSSMIIALCLLGLVGGFLWNLYEETRAARRAALGVQRFLVTLYLPGKRAVQKEFSLKGPYTEADTSQKAERLRAKYGAVTYLLERAS